MACFVIQESGQPDRLFQLTKREIIIGRGRSADLILPHTTVSKTHMRIKLDGSNYEAKNMSSGNTILLNGSPIQDDSQSFEHGTKFQIGRYTLLFFGDNLNPIQQFHNGQSLGELPLYVRTSQANRSDATFQLSPAMVQKTLKQGNLIRNARIVSKQQSWTPGDSKLIFGKGATVPISGFFTGGNVAEVEWDGGSHVLKKTSFMTKVSVNGNAISHPTALNEGDQFVVGSVSFTYTLSKQ
ncbi:MAG: FHA domain-containing protein [Myxococcota bacterium]